MTRVVEGVEADEVGVEQPPEQLVSDGRGCEEEAEPHG